MRLQDRIVLTVIANRLLPDGRVLEVELWTFGRARLSVARSISDFGYDDTW